MPIWGNINIYITSYLRSADDTITMESTYIVFPITITTGAIFMQLGAYMIEVVHPRVQMLIGGLSIAIPLFVCSYTKNFYLFVFLYSTVIGLGFGLLYMVALRNAWQYFPSKKGMMSGLIMSCYSVGAILWVIITKELANPNNLKPKEDHPTGIEDEKFYSPQSDVVANVPGMLRALSYIYLGLTIASTILINKRGNTDRRDELGRPLLMDHMDGATTTASVIQPGYAGTMTPNLNKMNMKKLISRNKPPLRKFSLKQSLMHRTFWHIFAMLLFSMAFTDFMKPQMKYFGTYNSYNDLFLTMVGILGFISSSLSKFAWGTVQDYLGFIKVYMLTLGLQAFVCFSLYSLSSNEALYAIMIFLVFVCEGAHFVIFPAVASGIYGSK